LALRFHGARSCHYYKDTVTDCQFANPNDTSSAFGGLGDQVEAGELSIPLGVAGHYLERSEVDKGCSVIYLTGNCDETHN